MSNIIPNRIDIIELDSSSYGENLNDRLSRIDKNFQNIIESDYLEGADGKNMYMEEIIIKSEDEDVLDLYVGENQITPSYLYEEFDKILQSGYKIKELGPINGITYNGNLEGSKVYLTYKFDEDGKKQVISMLSYTYIDPRFAPIKDTAQYEGKYDVSCVIVFDSSKDSDPFKSYNPFPTIYYDSSINGGDLCWKINGRETGIPCKGPQGNKGADGTSMYIGIYNEAEQDEQGNYRLIRILYQGDQYIQQSGDEGKFESVSGGSPNIDLKNGASIICFKSESSLQDEEIRVDININDSEDSDLKQLSTTYMISSVIANDNVGDDNYKYYIAGTNVVEVNLLSNLEHFKTLLSNLGKSDNADGYGYLRGLFVPISEKNGVISGHMMYADKDEDEDGNIITSNILCLAPVNDIAGKEIETIQDNTILKLRYNLTKVNDILSNDYHLNIKSDPRYHDKPYRAKVEEETKEIIEISPDSIPKESKNAAHSMRIYHGTLYKDKITLEPKNDDYNATVDPGDINGIFIAPFKNRNEEPLWKNIEGHTGKNILNNKYQCHIGYGKTYIHGELYPGDITVKKIIVDDQTLSNGNITAGGTIKGANIESKEIIVGSSDDPKVTIYNDGNITTNGNIFTYENIITNGSITAAKDITAGECIINESDNSLTLKPTQLIFNTSSGSFVINGGYNGENINSNMELIKLYPRMEPQGAPEGNSISPGKIEIPSNVDLILKYQENNEEISINILETILELKKNEDSNITESADFQQYVTNTPRIATFNYGTTYEDTDIHYSTYILNITDNVINDDNKELLYNISVYNLLNPDPYNPYMKYNMIKHLYPNAADSDEKKIPYTFIINSLGTFGQIKINTGSSPIMDINIKNDLGQKLKYIIVNIGYADYLNLDDIQCLYS